MKKLLCIIFSCVFLFSLTSCAFIDRLQGDMSQLDYNEEGNLLYNEITYYRADDRFEVITEDNDKVVELGWRQHPQKLMTTQSVTAPETPVFMKNQKKNNYPLMA